MVPLKLVNFNIITFIADQQVQISAVRWLRPMLLFTVKTANIYVPIRHCHTRYVACDSVRRGGQLLLFNGRISLSLWKVGAPPCQEAPSEDEPREHRSHS